MKNKKNNLLISNEVKEEFDENSLLPEEVEDDEANELDTNFFDYNDINADICPANITFYCLGMENLELKNCYLKSLSVQQHKECTYTFFYPYESIMNHIDNIVNKTHMLTVEYNFVTKNLKHTKRCQGQSIKFEILRFINAMAECKIYFNEY